MSFLVPSVTYLGYKIDSKGLHPTDEKLKAVQQAPEPSSVTELKAYLGLLTYYGRFLPHLPSVLAPLYTLLHKRCVKQIQSVSPHHQASCVLVRLPPRIQKQRKATRRLRRKVCPVCLVSPDFMHT